MGSDGNAGVTGKILYSGKLKLVSPLIIGTGEKDLTADDVLVKDQNGEPYIPATSLTGVMRHYMDRFYPEEHKNKKSYEYFWGSPKGKGSDTMQSALCLRDLYLVEDDRLQYSLRVRDGIAIDPKSGIAQDKKKFEYEVLEQGVSFQFFMIVTLRNTFSSYEDMASLAGFLLQALKDEKITIGAKTTRGFGRCRLSEINYCHLDFLKPEDVLNWLNRSWKESKWAPQEGTIEEGNAGNNLFNIESKFAIKNSLLIRSYSGDPEEPDAVQVSSNNAPVIPGTSLAGVIRARAHRIANTFMAEEKSEALIRPLFGWANDKEKDQTKYKSRVFIREHLLTSENIVQENQTRIKIDRFTGGTLKAHLFEEMPVWPKDEGEMVKIDLSVEAGRDYEIGLLLLVLKDLWSGDLPLGGGKNIGRGVLKGISAKLLIEGELVEIKSCCNEAECANGKTAVLLDVKKAGSGEAAYELLEEKVKAFHNYCKNGVGVKSSE
jgi:CRISPR/Cas system CSM-associated protein Csm3 (group 7 of RAMP superfamily)